MDKYVLYTSREQAILAKKAAAIRGNTLEAALANGEGVARKSGFVFSGGLGTRYATPGDFISDVWALFGDGRRFVDSTTRLTCIFSLLESYGFCKSAGSARLLAGFVRDYAPYINLATFDLANCSDAQQRIFSLATDYFKAIKRLGLIEKSEAIFLISSDAKRFDVSFATHAVLSPAEQYLFKEVMGLKLPDIQSFKLESGQKAQVLVAAGSSIITNQVFGAVSSYIANVSQAKVAILTIDPDALFDDLAPALIKQSATCVLSKRVAFGKTAFGRALEAFNLFKTSEDLSAAINAATDFLYSPFVGIDTSRVAAFNTQLRSDRTNTHDSILQALHDATYLTQHFEVLFSLKGGQTCLPEEANAALNAMLTRATLLDDISSTEIAAVNAFKLMLVTALSFGQGVDCALDLIRGSKFGSTFASTAIDGSSTRVDFLPMTSASKLAHGAYDMVVIGDVSDVAFNAKERPNAIKSLIDMLGAPASASAIDSARIAFGSAVAAATDAIAFVLPMRNKKGDVLYSSFVFDDFLSTNFNGLKAVDLVASDFMQDCSDRGSLCSKLIVNKAFEDSFVKGIGRNVATRCGEVKRPKPARGKLDVSDFERYVRAVALDDDTEFKNVLSPSAIEKYISCPYAWFVQNELRLGGVDEGFGALECGNFVHGVFEELYSRLEQEPFSAARVDAIDEAQLNELFEQVFNDVLDVQIKAEPASGRYVPVGMSEQLEVQNLKKQIRRNLNLQSKLPVDFGVGGQEVSINPYKDDEIINYAGVALQGKIDRFDINTQTDEFYILDYKGSVSAYNAGIKDFELMISDDGVYGFNPDVMPRHVQSLIYALALLREFKQAGKESSCVGAVYASYRARNISKFVNGSYSASAPDSLKDIMPAKAGIDSNFEDFLLRVEDAVSNYVDKLICGDIFPDPHFDDSCKYCPYLFCEKRR